MEISVCNANSVDPDQMLHFAVSDLHLYTVKPQWLEHLWDHGNLFETWVV